MNELFKENKAIQTIHRFHMIFQPGEVYRAFEDQDLLFYKNEKDDFIYLWNEGHSLKNIWNFLKNKYNPKRTFDEITILLLDLSIKGKVHPRAQGIHEAVWDD